MSEGTQERVERVEILRCPECGWHILRENGVDGQRCEAGLTDAELDCDGVCEVVLLVPAHLLDTAIEALTPVAEFIRCMSAGGGGPECPKDAAPEDACPSCRARSTLSKLERGTE